MPIELVYIVRPRGERKVPSAEQTNSRMRRAILDMEVGEEGIREVIFNGLNRNNQLEFQILDVSQYGGNETALMPAAFAELASEDKDSRFRLYGHNGPPV